MRAQFQFRREMTPVVTFFKRRV